MAYIRPNENYPINWNRLRFVVFKRDNYRCRMCGIYCKGFAQCHHIIPVGKGGSHHLDNLVTLCEDCHQDISLRRKRFR